LRGKSSTGSPSLSSGDLNFGGLTVVDLTLQGSSVTSRGIGECSPKDQFSKKFGTFLALQGAVADALTGTPAISVIETVNYGVVTVPVPPAAPGVQATSAEAEIVQGAVIDIHQKDVTVTPVNNTGADNAVRPSKVGITPKRQKSMHKRLLARR
jgi:hypothetical protein